MKIKSIEREIPSNDGIDSSAAQDAMITTLTEESSTFRDYYYGVTRSTTKAIIRNVIVELSTGKMGYSALNKKVAAAYGKELGVELKPVQLVRVLKKLVDIGIILREESIETARSSKPDKKKKSVSYSLDFIHVAKDSRWLRDVRSGAFIRDAIKMKVLTRQQAEREREILADVASIDSVKEILQAKYGESDLFKVLDANIKDAGGGEFIENIQEAYRLKKRFEHSHSS